MDTLNGALRRAAREVFYAALLLPLPACGRSTLPAAGGRADDAAADVHAASGSDAAKDAGIDTRHCTFKGFAPAVRYATADEPLSIVAVDLTGDGHLDLIVGERSASGATSELLANTGNGTFVLSASYGASGNNVSNMVAADFNGDGKLDLASESNGANGIDLMTNDGVLGIDFGTGGGRFASQLDRYVTPETTGYLTVGDFNGDGHPDIAFSGHNYVVEGGGIDGGIGLPAPEPADFALAVFLNAGAGTFARPSTYADPGSFQNIANGDFDGDGHLDIVGLTYTTPSGFGVFFNAGDGTFRKEVNVVASAGWIDYGLGVADFDGDGKDDVATTTTLNPNSPTEANVLEVFTGAANGGFNGPVNYPIATTPTVYQIVTGDFNGDGKSDLAMVIGHNSQGALIEPQPVTVFENRGDGTFGAPVTYTVGGKDLEGATAIAAGDFNGDGVTDIAVTTSSEQSPYPVAVNVLLSTCE
jgi:hypothetical protein